MKIKPEDHPGSLHRSGLGHRLKAAGYCLSVRGPSRRPDGSLDEAVEMTVTMADEAGSEPSAAQAIEAAELIKADGGGDPPEASDEPARVYIRAGKVYAQGESGEPLLLGTLGAP